MEIFKENRTEIINIKGEFEYMEVTKNIKVEQRLENLEGLASDGFWFDLNEGHISMYINYYSPTEEDIDLILNSEVNMKIDSFLGLLLVGLDIEDFESMNTLYLEAFAKQYKEEINIESFEGLESCPMTLHIVDTESAVCVGKRDLTLCKEALEKVLAVVTRQKHIKADVEPAVLSGAFTNLKDYIYQCPSDQIFKTTKQYIC